jgi:hypothetical protein
MRSFRSKRPTSKVDGRRSERTAGRSHERALAREAFGLRTDSGVPGNLLGARKSVRLKCGSTPERARSGRRFCLAVASERRASVAAPQNLFERGPSPSRGA